MKNARTIGKVIQSRPTIEGAGVHLKRVFGNAEVPQFDPFLMLDDFRSNHPDQYRAGFPWHPHRGIETITYVLKGEVTHEDSMGNKGVISSGDMQWMTAGSGIIHQEMPTGDIEGRMEGFQLWANLPKSHKMMAPRYRDIKSAHIPEVALENGVKIKVICGRVGGHEGPARGIIIEPEYLDVSIPAMAAFRHPTERGHTVFAYVIEGQGHFDDTKAPLIGNGTLCLYADGDFIKVTTAEKHVRFLLISGKPIAEPIAWYGPIVMNSDTEVKIAFEEYRSGKFIKHEKPSGV